MAQRHEAHGWGVGWGGRRQGGGWNRCLGPGGRSRWQREMVRPPGAHLGATVGMLEGPIFLKARLACPGAARFLPLTLAPCAQSPPASAFQNKQHCSGNCPSHQLSLILLQTPQQPESLF